MTIDTVVIPAAGKGTRVASKTKGTCKEMLPYNGLPLIEHAIIEAAKAGFTRIIVVSHISKKSLNQFLTSYPKVEVIYQDDPRGLGDAILRAKDHIKSEYFAVLLPDVILAKPVFPDLLDLTSKHRAPTFAVTALPKELVSYSGIIAPVRLKPLYGRITGIVEKPDMDQAPSNLGIIGRYILDKGIFDRLDKVSLTMDSTNQGSLPSELQLTPSIRIDSMYYLYENKVWDGGNPLNYE